MLKLKFFLLCDCLIFFLKKVDSDYTQSILKKLLQVLKMFLQAPPLWQWLQNYHNVYCKRSSVSYTKFFFSDFVKLNLEEKSHALVGFDSFCDLYVGSDPDDTYAIVMTTGKFTLFFDFLGQNSYFFFILDDFHLICQRGQ